MVTKPLNAVADDALHLLKDPALSPEGRAAACVEQVRGFTYPNAERREAAVRLLRTFADAIPHLRTNADGLGLMQAAGNLVMGARRLAEALPPVAPKDEIRRVAPAMTRFNYTGAEIDAIRGALRKDERIQQVEEFAVKTDQRTLDLNEQFYDSLRPGSWTLRDTWLSQFRRPGPGPARAEEAEGHPLRARFVR
jgi:hypothetical protein